LGRRRPAAALAAEVPAAALAQPAPVATDDGPTAVVAEPARDESEDEPTAVVAEPARGSVIAAEEPTAVFATLPAQREPEPEPEPDDAAAEADAEPEAEPEPAAEPESEPEPEPAPVAAAEPDPEPEPEQVPDDDLERIEGIGPKMSGALRAAGIRTYGKLAGCDEATLRAAIERAGLTFAPSIVTWARQARLLADGDEAGFADLTRRLVAGRDTGRV
jgi:predicted flap endonuclease-1-like 5' DNA nuclease